MVDVTVIKKLKRLDVLMDDQKRIAQIIDRRLSGIRTKVKQISLSSRSSKCGKLVSYWDSTT